MKVAKTMTPTSANLMQKVSKSHLTPNLSSIQQGPCLKMATEKISSDHHFLMPLRMKIIRVNPMLKIRRAQAISKAKIHGEKTIFRRKVMVIVIIKVKMIINNQFGIIIMINSQFNIIKKIRINLRLNTIRSNIKSMNIMRIMCNKDNPVIITKTPMTKCSEIIIILMKISLITAIKVNDKGPCKKGGGIQILTEVGLTKNRGKFKRKRIIIEMIGTFHMVRDMKNHCKSIRELK
jgi:hypothetical protein